jgi:hypothetical protein
MSASKSSTPYGIPLARAKTKSLLLAVEQSFADRLARTAGLLDPQAFKRALIESLERSVAFERAALNLHPLVLSALPRRPSPAPRGGPSQVPRRPRIEGRIQASHLEPSVGLRDRQRGYRLKGGKRVGLSGKNA